MSGNPLWHATGNVTGTTGRTDSVGAFNSDSAGTISGRRSKWVQDYDDEPDVEMVRTGKPEKKFQWYRENALEQFLTGSDEVMQKAFLPIYGAKQKTGDNMADIIMGFGGRNAALYQQVKTPFGQKPDVTLPQAMNFEAGMQGADRAMKLAQLSVRDSGSMSLFAADNQMALMVDPTTGKELLPGVRDSMVYAQTKQTQISAQNKTWQDYDQGHFNMDRMKLSNEEQRYQVSPYSPGNRMEMELRGLKLDKEQIATIQDRESLLQMKGLLSEDQQFAMESQIDSLKTDRDSRIGNMVDGVANRLPAMAAGRPGFADRIDSRQMMAMQMGLIGHPYRGAGALNDGQRRMQEGFLAQYLDPSELESRSRTVNLNNGIQGASSRAAGVAQGSVRDSGPSAAGVNGGTVNGPTVKSQPAGGVWGGDVFTGADGHLYSGKTGQDLGVSPNGYHPATAPAAAKSASTTVTVPHAASAGSNAPGQILGGASQGTVYTTDQKVADLLQQLINQLRQSSIPTGKSGGMPNEALGSLSAQLGRLGGR
jgi:hypothetical protein